MPHRHARLVGLVLAAALGGAACEAETPGAGGTGDGGSPQPAAGPVTRLPGDTTPFALEDGMYRVAWKTTGCTSVTIELVGDTGYTKKQTSTVPNHSTIATGVDAGTYTVTQSDPACAEWEITVGKVGG